MRRSCSVVAMAVLAALAVTGRPRCSFAQQWVDGRAFGPFICRAEFPLTQCEDLLGELEQLQGELVRCLGIPPAREQIEIYLFRDKWSYQRYLKKHLPNVPYRRALYVKRRGPGQVFAYQSRQLGIDLRHECTHAMLHAVLPVVPLWLDEGLAEYFEVPAHRRAFDNPHLGNLRWNLRLGIIPKLEGLEKIADMPKMSQTEYRYSWAWVHFMLHGPREAHAELGGYLSDLRSGRPPGLLSERLQRRLGGVRGQFAAHFKGWKR